MAPTSESSVPSSFSWRKRSCHRLWHVMVTLWRVIVTDIAFITPVNILTNSTDTLLPKLYVIHWIIMYHILLFAVMGRLLALTAISWVGGHEQKASLSLSPDLQSRIGILKTLQKAYKDEFTSSLQEMAQITLKLQKHFDLRHILLAFFPGTQTIRSKCIARRLQLWKPMTRQGVACRF